MTIHDSVFHFLTVMYTVRDICSRLYSNNVMSTLAIFPLF